MSVESFDRSLPNRPLTGVFFGEVIEVRKREQSRSDYGELSETSVTKFVRTSSNPLGADDERAADLQASGVRLSAVREFFTDDEIRVKERDEIKWDGDIYIAIQSANWGTFFSTLAVRKEDQANGN